MWHARSLLRQPHTCSSHVTSDWHPDQHLLPASSLSVSLSYSEACMAFTFSSHLVRTECATAPPSLLSSSHHGVLKVINITTEHLLESHWRAIASGMHGPQAGNSHWEMHTLGAHPSSVCKACSSAAFIAVSALKSDEASRRAVSSSFAFLVCLASAAAFLAREACALSAERSSGSLWGNKPSHRLLPYPCQLSLKAYALKG